MKLFNLSDLMLNTAEQYSKKTKNVGICILLIVFLVGGFFLFIQRQYLQLQELYAKELQLNTDITIKQKLALPLQQLQQKVHLQSNHLASMLQKLPTVKETSELLEEISKTGLTLGLKFAVFSPQTIVQHDFFDELPIRFQVKGSFTQLLIFLKHLSDMKKWMALNDVLIQKKAPQNTTFAEELEMELIATIYRLKANVQ